MPNYTSSHQGSWHDDQYIKSEITNTFLSKADANSIYLKKTDAASIYLSKADAINIYKGTLYDNSWEQYDLLTGDPFDSSTYASKWHFEFFSEAAVDSNSYTSLKGATPRTDIPERYGVMHTTTSGNLFNVHNYRCRCTTYIYCEAPLNISFSWASDDEGACWVNGVYIGANTSCAYGSTYWISLHEGCNEICIIYHEGGGGEWAITNPVLSNNASYAVYARQYGYTQTTTLNPIVENYPLNINSYRLATIVEKNDMYDISGANLIENNSYSFLSSPTTITTNVFNTYRVPFGWLDCLWFICKGAS